MLRAGGGQPLDRVTRSYFELRFGRDLSDVRVHTDQRAAASARQVNAAAYTFGQDIVFRQGAYAPETPSGKRLLAHELAHVSQRGSAAPVAVSQPGEASEQDADRVAEAVLSPARDVPRVAAPAPHILHRQKDPKAEDEVAQLIAQSDWYRAARALAPQSAADIEARVRALPPAHRQYLVVGAKHGEGVWDGKTLLEVIDKVSHRDAIFGNVRFFVWKHLWEQAGTYLCGLNDDDIRRSAKQLSLTFDDLHAIADAQPIESQKVRLNVAFFSQPEFVKQIPKDLVGKDADKLAKSWLSADPLVGPYAKAKWGDPAAKLTVHVVPADKWADEYSKHSTGRFDPALNRNRTDEDSRVRAVTVEGFTDEDSGNIYLREGSNKPGALIHEAIHALAPSVFNDTYGTHVNEGTTEFFARLVATNAGKHPSKAYGEEHAGVAALAAVAGTSLLAESFFTGKQLKLESAVDAAKGDGTFRAWLEAMKDDAQRKTAPKLLGQ